MPRKMDNYIIDLDSFMNIDNGNGILLSKYEIELLLKYDIDYRNYSNIESLLKEIDDVLENDYIEELEDIVIKLEEQHYYKDIKKAKDLLSDIYNRYCGGEIPEGHFALWGYICLQEKDLQKAEYYLMHDTGPDSSPYATIGTYEMWSMLYEQKKEYRKALDYVKRAGELRDSIYVVEKDKLVQNLERQYRTELLRAENEELHTINVYLFIIFLISS